ncbi:MAG: 3-deoxy-D-manno-octulosonic acid transferase, partial [Betaproteobacteria bacterium AqS2]|nr:3-deoxy-D-manno-octulosonic acid transferase [Betaproteobacteria bacterium AqS2]
MQALGRAAYALVLALLLPAYALAKLRRGGPAALRLRERWGLAPPAGAAVWANFASLGEFNACKELLLALQQRGHRLLLTHSAEAARAIAARATGAPVHALPLDFASTMARFVRRQRPRLCLLVEQELWPNLVDQVRRRGAPVAVVNARLSRRTARRHARLFPFTRRLFEGLDLVCAQDADAARRFRALGAPRVEVTGNMKFDRRPDAAKVAEGEALRRRLNEAWPGRPVLLLASTRAHRGQAEEKLLLDALAPLLAKVVLLLVPRHLERMDEAAKILAGRGLAYSRRSSLAPDARPAAMVLGDTLGSMDCYVACADLVFMGASLVAKGGQNPMEAFVQGKAVLCGPHM